MRVMKLVVNCWPRCIFMIICRCCLSSLGITDHKVNFKIEEPFATLQVRDYNYVHLLIDSYIHLFNH